MDIRDNAVKVYKDTGWVWFEVIFLIAIQALFVYFMFTSDLDLWLYVVLSVALIIISITHFFDIKKNRNTVVVYPDYLEIEPLKLECQHFISCCETGKKARSDGENGFIVVRILEEAEKIMLGDRAKNLDNVSFALSRSKKI